MSLCPASVRSATQYREIRSLIQTEAQTYKILPLIPNRTSAFLVRHANGYLHNVVDQRFAIRVWRRRPIRAINLRTHRGFDWVLRS